MHSHFILHTFPFTYHVKQHSGFFCINIKGMWYFFLVYTWSLWLKKISMYIFNNLEFLYKVWGFFVFLCEKCVTLWKNNLYLHSVIHKLLKLYFFYWKYSGFLNNLLPHTSIFFFFLPIKCVFFKHVLRCLTFNNCRLKKSKLIYWLWIKHFIISKFLLYKFIINI